MRTVGENGTAAVELALGQAYDGLSQYALAIEHYKRSLAIKMRTVGENGCIIVLKSLGHAHTGLHELESALEYFQRAVHICDDNAELSVLHRPRTLADLEACQQRVEQSRTRMATATALEKDKSAKQVRKKCRHPATRPMVTAADVAQADENMAALLLEEAMSKTNGKKDGVTANSLKGVTKKK